MRVEPKQLKAFVIDAKLVTENQFDQALKKSKKGKLKVEDVLVAEGLIKQIELTKLKAYIL